jgi:hypothetical protein
VLAENLMVQASCEDLALRQPDGIRPTASCNIANGGHNLNEVAPEACVCMIGQVVVVGAR